MTFWIYLWKFVLIAALILLYEFFWQVLIVAVLAIGIYILWDNLREIRA